MDAIVTQAEQTLLERRRGLFRLWKTASETDQQMFLEKNRDWADAANDEVTQRLLNRLSERERRELDEIDAALARIREGSYGTCESCGGDIARQRLAAVPEARFCVSCASTEMPRRTRFA